MQNQTMTRSEVRSIVIAELVAVEQAIGCPVPTITDSTRPIGDLEGFDSQVSEDTTATILGNLGAPPETKNPFTLRDGQHHVTLDRIVDYFCRAAGVKET